MTFAGESTGSLILTTHVCQKKHGRRYSTMLPTVLLDLAACNIHPHSCQLSSSSVGNDAVALFPAMFGLPGKLYADV